MSHIAGFVPFTTIDYPDHLAAVVFFQGCPLKCPYCHNPDLQDFTKTGTQEWEDILIFLKRRRGLLDAVVLSGGEPLMQPDITTKAKQAKALGLKVGVHTSGAYPDQLKALLPYIDWVGLDVKAPWKKYGYISPMAGLPKAVQECVKMLIDQGKAFEARTTADPRFLTLEDVETIATDLHKKGVKNFALQLYRTFPGDKHPPTDADIHAFQKDTEFLGRLQKLFPTFTLRGGE